MYQSLKKKGLAAQFEFPGVYAVLLDGRIVYIGKSVNMLLRMAQHFTHLKIPTDHKYRLLAEAAKKGHSIRFIVLRYARAATKEDIKEEIGYWEGVFIRQHRPQLNTQIPKAENWKSYSINPEASKITLMELLDNRKRAESNDSTI